MVRRISLFVPAAAIVIVGGYLACVGGCSTPQTHIAQRTLNGDVPALAAATAVEDWPQWRGPHGDELSHERIGDAFPEGGPRSLWSADVGLGYSSPVVAAGRVYLFSLNQGKEDLTAFDANTGQILWNAEGGDGWTSRYAGTRATPAIDGDRIYTHGGHGELTCRDLADGHPIWRVSVPAETGGAGDLFYGRASCPLVTGELVVVQGGTSGPVAVAFDKRSGSIAWRSQATGVAGYAQIVLADVGGGTSQLIVFAGDAIYGLDPATGRTAWSYPWKTSYNINASTPIVRDGRLFVTSEYGHGCALFQLSPAGAPKQIWANTSIMGKFQGAILDGECLYANSSGTLTCVAWADGSVKWRATDTKMRLGVGGSLIRSGDKVIALSERGKLSLIRATPDGATLLAQAPVLDGTENWSTPALYGGRLYAKGAQELTCLEMPKGQ